MGQGSVNVNKGQKGGEDIEMGQGSGSVDKGQKDGGDTEMGQGSGGVAEGQKGRGDTEMGQGSISVDEGQKDGEDYNKSYSQRGRKRIRNPDNWAKNVKKERKNSGKSYIGHRGKLYTSKKLKKDVGRVADTSVTRKSQQI